MSIVLARAANVTPIEGPVVVIVMDGVGIGAGGEGDAVALARTPTLDMLKGTAFYRTLKAHGRAVGLPSDDDMGNSEVGHNALGAGRVFDQGAKLVQEAIASGAMFEGATWRSAVARVKASGEPLHLMGLLSDGNVHSHIEHLIAMLRRAAFEGVPKARVHALLDGRDVSETSALIYVEALERVLHELSAGGRDYRIASGGGRMRVTMDRYGADWAMVERGWRAHVLGEGRKFSSAREAIETFRAETPGIGDQNLPPFVVAGEGGEAAGPIRDGASVLFFNFRGDRAIEITRAFEDDAFPHFDRVRRPDAFYAGMMQYDGDLALPRHFLVTPPAIDRTLGEYLAKSGVSQLAISETQKYGHVTYFWNGNRSGMFDETLETYVEIPSDTRPFEERPWMKAAEITDRAFDEIRARGIRHARLNYANGDMVGHTGFRDAAVVAVEAVDLQLARWMTFIEETRGALVVTADHGNADEMFELDKKSGAFVLDAQGRTRPKTSHTLNAVPCAIWLPHAMDRFTLGTHPAGLANVAATVMTLLGFVPPDDYEPSLLLPR
jgi:2,3-bisphosphoglycerate-independent phosphoglycerate mutase